ncbi:hypothetical protein I553_5237 [Mycobacterium xenopi 4042]|uniref:Uncharacterized protein n=1 Tax=Mycobacterium xenopi 4042 TaxID=1299334 RepID=X7ZTS8_MYCXE|nr:hypothetical protein I553_5237 [Mycobacterium xenopi 4042]
MVTHATNRGPRTSTPSAWAVVLVLDTELLLLTTGRLGHAGTAAPRAARKARYSAATTTAAARDAAQVDCAALGEHGLEAGEHVGQLT